MMNKRILAIGLAVTLSASSAFAATTVTAYDKALNLMGDVNSDGVVDNLDAAWILKYDAGLLLEGVPDTLVHAIADVETEAALCNAHYNRWKDSLNLEEEGYTVADVWVDTYYGTYSGCPVADMAGNWMPPPDAVWYADVAGYTVFGGGPQVCRDGKMYSLLTAYENGYITKEDVFSIGIKVGIIPDKSNMDYMLKESIGDVNGDYVVDNLDAAMILKYDAGIIPEL